MVELRNKYKIGVRRFSKVNWVGLYGLWAKECARFLIVWQQTILSPIVSASLLLLVLYLAIGDSRGEVLNTPFITFLTPGLICNAKITSVSVWTPIVAVIILRNDDKSIPASSFFFLLPITLP